MSHSNIFRCVLIVAALVGLATPTVSKAQTFLDRQNPDSVRVVSYNMFWDELVTGFDAPNELARLIDAVDADIWNFQELATTSASELAALFDTLAPLPGGATWQAQKGRNQIIVSRYPLSLRRTDIPGGTRGIAMALVDLPDAHFVNDMYILNNHFACCDNEFLRTIEANRIIEWMDDAKTTGGTIDLPQDTAIFILGDLNIVGSGEPLDILLDGVGGLTPDWDGSSITDANPLHNAVGPADWTWRNDQSGFDPGVLDFVLYTDSVIDLEYSYVLNPSEMTTADLVATGLLATDFMLNKNTSLGIFDHLPLVTDFSPTVEVLAYEFPTTFNLFRGIQLAGTLTDALESDNSYMEFNPGFTLTSLEAPVWLEFDGELAAAEYQLRIESQSNTPGLEYTAEMFNWTSNSYETVGVLSESFNQDSIEAYSLSPEHVDGSGSVKTRVGWRATGFTLVFPWQVRVDQIGWQPN